MGSTSLIPSGGSGLSPSNLPSPSEAFAKMVQNAPRRLEYLRNQKSFIGNAAKWLLTGGVLLWAGLHFQQINDFFDNLATLAWKLGVAGVAVFGAWAIWHIISSETFQFDVAFLLDRVVMGLHRAVVVHNDVQAAEFSIGRLEARAKEVDQSRGAVNSARDDSRTTAANEKKEVAAAFQQAQGIRRELDTRASHGGKPVDPNLADYSSTSLENLFNLAQHKMKIHYGLYQNATAKYEMLVQRTDLLKEVSEAVWNIIEESKLELDTLVKTRELDAKTYNAMYQSGEVLGGQEMKTFQMAVQNIRDGIDSYNGQISILMDRLDPAVQSYRLGKVGGKIADEQFYQQWVEQAGVVKPEAKEKLLAASSVTTQTIPEVEDMLGNHASAPEPVPVPRTRRQAASSFDDLLRR